MNTASCQRISDAHEQSPDAGPPDGELRAPGKPRGEEQRRRQHRGGVRVRRRDQRVIERVRADPRGNRCDGCAGGPADARRHPPGEPRRGGRRGDARDAWRELQCPFVSVRARGQAGQRQQEVNAGGQQIERRPEQRRAYRHVVSDVPRRREVAVDPLGSGLAAPRPINVRVLVLKMQVAVEHGRAELNEMVGRVAEDRPAAGARGEGERCEIRRQHHHTESHDGHGGLSGDQGRCCFD
jgi:hypothetical protein